MKKIAQFHKVSQSQFLKDWSNCFINVSNEEVDKIYSEIMLPKRATIGSAGYDFFAPVEINLNPSESMLIPTGIRVSIEDGWVLKCYPRSGLGFKFRLQLNNTVGIIDSDYYYSENEGHIFAKITNDSKEEKKVNVPKRAGFIQGIFLEYGITYNDCVEEVRNGGFGSTTEKKIL